WTDNVGIALWALERGRLAAGERVVVFGPGAIGLCAAPLARALGAGSVLVVEFAGTSEAARAAILTARRGGRVVLGGSTGLGTELSGLDLSTIVRGNI